MFDTKYMKQLNIRNTETCKRQHHIAFTSKILHSLMNEIPPNIIHFFMLFVVISVRQWYEEVRHPPTTTAKISLITVRKSLTRQASETTSHYLIQHQVLNPVLSKLIPSEHTSRHGVASSCNVSVPEWISRPAGLKSMRELSKHPLVIDHVKLTNISPNVRVVLAWQWWLWTWFNWKDGQCQENNARRICKFII